MGVCNTDGVAPQESHGRTFGRTRIQLRGPGSTEGAFGLTLVLPIEVPSVALQPFARSTLAEGFGLDEGF
jgi:hypothetical protein